MKHRTLKAMIGWYAARRKGPRWRRRPDGPRVQASTPASGDAEMAWIGTILSAHAKSPERLSKWLKWATQSDGAVGMSGTDWTALKAVRALAEERGLVDAKPQLPKVEHFKWKTRDGIKQETFRIAERLTKIELEPGDG